MAQATGMVRSLFSNAASPTGIDRQQVEAVVDVVDRLVFTRPTTILNLTKLKTKDEISFQHSIAVCALVGLFARHLKLEAKLVRILCVSGLLHDIGKLRIPTAILTKNGMLTAEEIAVMQTHPRKGYEILARGTGLPDIVGKVCLQHHEKLDGSGYPTGFRGGRDRCGGSDRRHLRCFRRADLRPAVQEGVHSGNCRGDDGDVGRSFRPDASRTVLRLHGPAGARKANGGERLGADRGHR